MGESHEWDRGPGLYARLERNESMGQELRTERQRTDQEMKALLDESQEAQCQEMRREEWREERPHGGGAVAGPMGNSSRSRPPPFTQRLTRSPS